MRVVCVLFLNSNSSMEQFLEYCYQYSPDITFRKSEAAFIEISRCQFLFEEKSLVDQIQLELKKKKSLVRVSVADSFSSSLALARFSGQNTELLPLEALYDFSDPFDLDPNLKNKISSMIEVLKKLGIQTIQDFLTMPPSSLNSRFGKIADLCVRRFKFPDQIPWQRWQPKEEIVERIDLAESYDCTDLEPILFFLKKVLNQIEVQLKIKMLQISKIKLDFELEPYSHLPDPMRSWVIEFALPQSSTQGVLSVIREKLSRDLSRCPLEAPVKTMMLRVQETSPGKSGQSHFFHKKEEEEEGFHSLVNRFSEKLGRTQVFRAKTNQSYLPEKSWDKITPLLSESKKLNSFSFPYPLRPLRFLNPPWKLSRLGRTLKGPQFSWKVLSWQGPERISGEWWGENFSRDYYHVQTETGVQLWIFRNQSGELFLHGFFD